VMLYLAGVMAVAVYLGRGPSVLASLLSVAALNFFFVPPLHTFAVADVQYVVTFAVMLIAALTMSELAARVRLQAKIAGYREERTSALYEMTRELAATESVESIVRIGVEHVSAVFHGAAGHERRGGAQARTKRGR
jgi:two-component system, OmpR family, sensor histidine kinase KdpD